MLAAAVPLLVVVACGPDFQPEVFVPQVHPESAPAFSSGRLGVLQPGYARADKVVAYRYLIGGRLSDAEKAAYIGAPIVSDNAKDWQAQHDVEEAAKPVNQWRAARAAALKTDIKTTPEIAQEKTLETKRDGYVQTTELLNCPDDAFVAAKAALASRTKQWGEGSADLTDWLRGQDAVFSNCSKVGDVPQPAPANASALLKMDREYQIAAAKFYTGDYDGAIAGFEVVAKDTLSPWSPWGEYLAARAEVRQAAMATPQAAWGEQSQFDPALLRQAQARLEKIAATGDARMKHAAQAELGFIEVRLDPKKRLNDSANALAGPAPDTDFAQHLGDVLFLTGRDVIGNTDLLRWMGHSGGNVDAAAEWRAKHTTPWLVTALMSAKAGDVSNADILNAAAKLPVNSPAYVTVSYERARLMLAAGDQTGARRLTTSVLSVLSGEGTNAARNTLLGLRVQTAASYAEFLADAPRTTIDTDKDMSQSAGNALCGNSQRPPGCVEKIPALQFDWDTATAFNRQLPLSRWVEAMNAKELPAHLRESVVMAAWLRALGLNDEVTVKATSSMLPEPLQKAAGDSTGFPATLALLRNPGMRPYLEQGVQRSVSFRTLDSFRDNWWCSKWGDGPTEYNSSTNKPVVLVTPMSFLPAAEKAAAADEAKRLNTLPFGVMWLGRRAIDYVKAHPDDNDAAEALALTVRATRYGCYISPESAGAEQKAVSKEAFTILHKQYPKSQWAAKTPYYY